MAATPSLHACPVCDFELQPGADKCPNCTTNLRLFTTSAESALDFYNQGLDLAREGDRAAALEKMRGALAADPKMVDAYIVAGKLLAQSGKTGDLEQAIAYWEKGRGLRPTGDQARKLDNCIETADASLRRLERQAQVRRRNVIGSLIAGGVVVAAMCGVAGYSLNRAHPKVVTIYRTVAADKQLTGQQTAPMDPVEAINKALARPDITVTQTGDKLRLAGKVGSESEKKITVSAAAFASKRPESQIDATGLKVKPVFKSVGGRRVELMLRLFVRGLDRKRSDPLYGAKLSVTGGMDKEVLKVTGTCHNANAGREIVNLVKEVYPSANPVDVSGLKTAPVRRASRPPAAASRQESNSHVARQAQNKDDQVYINLAPSSYRVKPGDSIYKITQKYGHGSTDWHLLYEANRKTLKNPNSIPAGTVLNLPRGWHTSDKTDGGAP